MANTTNFNWETPDDTDLVKDGAAAIRTLGSAIDTSLVDLKGGTTGQVLSKATNTDMDFTWVAQDDSNAIQNAIIDAKGDLIVGTAADTPARLAVGTNGYILTADSTQTAGVKWAAASGASIQTATFRDEKTSGTSGGTFTSGAWRTRDLNTSQFNNITSASLASNQITLPAGTYTINATAPVYDIGYHQLRFYNITDSTTAVLGISNYLRTGASATSMISTASGSFTIAGSKTFEVQHQCDTTKADSGFGVAISFGTEVYATVTITKVA